MGLARPRVSKVTTVYILRELCASPSHLLLPPVGNLTILGTVEPREELEDCLGHCKGNLLQADCVSNGMMIYVLWGLCASPSRLLLPPAGKFDHSWDGGSTGGASGLSRSP